MKKVLFFSCEPGGAEVLIPVIRLLQNRFNYEVMVASYGHGLARFIAKGILCRIISKLVPNELDLLTQWRPDVLITSATSLPQADMSERYLWMGARKLGIPSIAFLDQWQNYAIRFSGCDAQKRLTYLPDVINCINEVARKEMLKEGFDANRLRMFGQPYLSSLEDDYARLNAQEILGRVGLLPDRPVALFVSEPIRQYFGVSRGYDQYDSLKMFMSAVAMSPMKPRPIIKLHPKDERESYDLLLKNYQDMRPLILRNELNSIECINIAGEVYGMTSIMLIEAFVLGKKVFSFQPGLKVDDPMILSKLGFIPKCTALEFTGTFDPPPDFSQTIPFDFYFKEEAFLGFLGELLAQPDRVNDGN